MASEHVNPQAVQATASPSAYHQFLQRDGSSQAERLRPSLQPDYITVDERSLQDLLAFAREYAKELQYFEVKEGQVQATADWQAFLNEDIDLDEVVAFMQDPAKFPPGKAQLYTRPHFALFLTFLQLMRHAQDQLNTLTRRHLDFYYQQVLQMSKRAGIPDQVNVLVDIAPDADQFQLPAGTLLAAGTDSLGQDLIYGTDRDVVVSHAQVSKLSSLFSEKQIIGIREAREDHTGPKEEGIIKMMEMTFGMPNPSDPMPLFPHPEGDTVDYNLLQKLLVRVSFLEQTLLLRFDEFDQLMHLKGQRDNSAAEWEQINAILEQAGKTRTQDDDYRLNPQDTRDFDANLRTAVGDPPHFSRLFDGIPEVKTIYDAYNKRNRADLQVAIQNRIQERLYLPVTAADKLDFTTLMQIKIRIDNEWNEINRILAEAGQRKGLLQSGITFPSPVSFQVEDILDWIGFLQKLVSENDPAQTDPVPGNRIWEKLHADIQQMITDLAVSDEMTLKETDKIAIIEALNDVLYQRDFYQAENFAALSLTQEIQDLLGQDLQTLSSSEVQQLNHLLIQAAYADEIGKRTLPLTAPADFDANLHIALGAIDFPEQLPTIDDYHAALLEIDHFFLMSAENFAYLMQTAEKEVNSVDTGSPTPQEWTTVYALLAEAYKEKVFAAHRAQLQEVRETEGFDAMVMLALGESASSANQDNPLTDLQEFTSPADGEFLQDVQQRVEDGRPVSEAEWQRVYLIVELVQRSLLDEPVAQKETWLNLYAAADATAVTSKLGVDAAVDSLSWHTFGHAPTPDDASAAPSTEIGWALSSPLLTLSEGERTIQLTLGFSAEQFDAAAIAALFADKDSTPFRIEVTTEDGWIEPDTTQILVDDYHKLTGIMPEENGALLAIQFQLHFAPNAGAIAPLPEAETRIGAKWPQLRLLLRQIWQPQSNQSNKGRYIIHYKQFKDLLLQQVHVQVEALGVTPAQLQNDETVLDAHKPFEPFGTQAVAGARFLLSHPELVVKRLDSLKFQVQWMGVPADLASHYAAYHANYGVGILGNDSFTVRLSLVDNRLELPLPTDGISADYPLFARGKASDPHTISISDLPAAIDNGRKGYPYQRALELVTNAEVQDWNRYFQWELNEPDFQQELYPQLAAERSVALAAALSTQSVNNENIASFQVNPPYTPKIKRLQLDYTASTTITLASYEPGAQIDRLLYMQPFGINEMQAQRGTTNYPFLPQFDFEGELYIGIENTQPSQSLSLLFQMAEGSANPDLEPVPVRWSYLDNNRWLSLDDGKVLQDSTRGLINSGIITFALEAIRPSTLLPPNYYWIRAAIPHRSSSVCDTVAIHAQAVSATFIDQENAPDHLHQPLAADSITALVDPLPEAVGIRQPYTSYGGKMAEQDDLFYTRISERLRHKQRALTIWDYEHLILENFPQIYKVKCLPANPENPGLVEIVVIPDIKNKIPFNPFEPKAPTDLIVDIETFLADKIPAFATVKVKNATFVPVKVRFGVRFRPGYNEGFYRQQLNEDINHFLSPWAYEEGADIVIGGRIYANVLINFIEERPYVDFVAQMKLFSSEDGKSFQLALPSDTDGYWIETNRPDGVLVAARQHIIDVLPETGYEEEFFIGLGYMKIELDFVIG